MALKALLAKDDYEKLDSGTKAHYREEKGKYILDVESVDGYQLKPVASLMSALEKEREQRETLERAVKAFEGVDPAAARDALKKVGEMASWTPGEKAREREEAIARQLTEKHGGELKSRDERIGKLMSHLDGAVRRSAAAAAIAAKKGRVSLLLPTVLDRLKLEEGPDGQFRTYVVDERGQRRITNRSGSTDPMGIEELVEELRGNAEFAPAFEGSGASGGGTQPTQPSTNGAHTITEAQARSDPRAYQQARAAAEKAGVPLQLTR